MRRLRSKRAEFEQFAANHGVELVRLGLAISGDRERAQDAAQDALMRVYQRWSRLDNPLLYARRAMVNATRDDWRRSIRQARIQERMANLRPPPNEDPQERFAENQALLQALAELPHGQRAVVILRYRLDLSEAETALVLQVSPGTVKTQISRALAGLREALSETTTIEKLEAVR